MPEFFSQYLNVEMEGLEETQAHHDTSQSSASFDTGPDMDQILMFGELADQSPQRSPISSPLEFGSAPTSFPMLDLQNSMVQNGLYLNIASHSFPGVHQHAASYPSVSSILAQEQGEDHSWMGEVFMRHDEPTSFMHRPPASTFSSGLSSGDFGSSHVPEGWLSPTTSALHRTESVISHNSFESFVTNNSFDDFSIDNSFTFADYDSNALEALPVELDVTARVDANTFGAEISFNAGPEDATTPRPILKSTKPGRKGVLTQEQKNHAARIRRVGACGLCRKRRAKCDDGIPCSTCKKYFRNDPDKLAENPCRGESLKELADLILDTNAFPKGPWTRFLSRNYSIELSDLRISLDLGFGHVPFHCRISLVRDRGDAYRTNSFFHKHVDYPWPPRADSSIRHIRQDMVFPAILADDENAIASQVEAHLTRMLNDKNQFQYFPVWFSELKVLRLFYKYFLTLSPRARNPLKQAFQILILVHVGGDLRLLRNDPTTARINDKFFPDIPHEHISPCFIRAQFGPIFSKVAHKLMSNVLKQLERLSSLQDPAHFPMVIATFSILFMALESLQYHFAKLAYHSDNDAPSEAAEAMPPKRDLDNFEAADILLRFYQSTSCHERLGSLADLPRQPDLSPVSRSRSRAGSTSSARWPTSCPASDNHGALEFLQTLGYALRAAAPYMTGKDAMNSIVPASDMSCFFDRLLAKMYRLPPIS